MWQECILNEGVLAEFPLDLYSPDFPEEDKLEHFMWSSGPQKIVNGDYVTVPLFESIDVETAKREMESLGNYFDRIEVKQGNKTGLVCFERLKLY